MLTTGSKEMIQGAVKEYMCYPFHWLDSVPCSAVTYRVTTGGCLQRLKRTGWHDHTQTLEVKGTERDGWELWVSRGKPLVLLVYLQDILSCASFGLKSGIFPSVHHKVKEGLCFITSCSRRSRSVRAFSRADWTSASLDSRDWTNRETDEILN